MTRTEDSDNWSFEFALSSSAVSHKPFSTSV